MIELIAEYVNELTGWQWLRMFSFVSVRAGLALAFAFVTSVALGPMVIRRLQAMKLRQPIKRFEGENSVQMPESHLSKEGTPSMGGVLILFSMTAAALLFCRLDNPMLWALLVLVLGFGMIGLLDDLEKALFWNARGLKARTKLILQTVLAGLFALWASYGFKNVDYYYMMNLDASRTLFFPFFKEWAFYLGVFYVPLATLVIVGASNSVNLTDGLDGLAIGVSTMVAVAFAVMAYLIGRVDFAEYLIVPHVRGASELCVLLCGFIGAGLGFLWFNSNPASVFMGDTGALAIGALFGGVAVLLKQEIILAIIGGVFVFECLSVILQVTSFRLWRRRVFLMSPFHHHLQKLGWAESKIIVRMWIVSLLLALLGLSTLKIR
ncbi:MAG: phospho-N-acetylmuramoyl-pentapeptide-transferase [Candidatus Sumerlaeia bacterium]